MKRRTSGSKEKGQPGKCPLRTLRNIGPALERKLNLIGIETVEEFLKSDPEEMYARLQRELGGPVDRCVLYCFRGARLNLPWPRCKDLKT